MRAVVAVTDDRWADFLRARGWLTEANFWLPSSSSGFRSLQVGEPFLFKTHHPHNRLVGGGFFSGYTRLKVSEAWDFFGEGNGVAGQADLLRAINGYRPGPGEPDPVIGCVLVRDLFFVPSDEAPAAPPDFASNIVRWKTYELTGDSYVERALRHILRADGTASIPGPVFGDPRLTVPRLGQQAFKSMVLTAYHRRCAITGARITPVLQAAHIRPVAAHGEHRLDNGVLLRSDVHTLFDRGYLGLDDGLRLQVSPRLRADFGNGAEFYARAGSQIDLPERKADRPSRAAVSWHMDAIFRR
jgi:putative restriction endonuclease